MSEAPDTLVTPEPPEALCGARGFADGVAITGACVFTKGHAELLNEPLHTWEKD